jgi:chaperonin GroEL
MDLHRGSQAAVDRVVEFLANNTKTITTTAEICQVAAISANGDVHVGNLIAQAVEKIGKEGGHHPLGGPDHRGRDHR